MTSCLRNRDGPFCIVICSESTVFALIVSENVKDNTELFKFKIKLSSVGETSSIVYCSAFVAFCGSI